MKHAILSAVTLALAASLAGCAGIPDNRSMNSINEPVVERTNYTIDLATGSGGLSYPEQQRLAAWFEEMDLRYGDRIGVEDPLQDETTRATIEALAARHGLAVTLGIPAAAGFVEAGTTRIVVTRSKAVVYGCPNWSAHATSNPNNALSRNYGCATNSNLAAMIANPEHLLKGDDNAGDTTIMSSNKAIGAYRSKSPTGAGDLKATGSKDN